MNNKYKQKYLAVEEEIDFEDKVVIKGYTQFGFYSHTGCRYVLDYQRSFVGKLDKNGNIEWSVGPQIVEESKKHISYTIENPVYISEAFNEQAVIISDKKYVYKLDLNNFEIHELISKDESGIIDIGNCVFDKDDDIWINDVQGNRVFHYDFSGNLKEIVGNIEAGFQKGKVSFSEARFNWNYDLRLGNDNHLYLLDSKNYAIRKIDIKSKIVETICGDGIGGYTGDGNLAIYARLGNSKSEHFDGPWSLAIDEMNNIYIGDTQNKVVRMINSETGVIDTVLRGGNKTVFEKICSLDYFDGKLFIPDWREKAPRTLVVAKIKYNII